MSVFAECFIKFAAGVIVSPNVFIADIMRSCVAAVFDLADVLAVVLCGSYFSCRGVPLF